MSSDRSRFSSRSAFERRPNSFARALGSRAEPPRYDLTVSNPTRVGLLRPPLPAIALPADYRPDARGNLAARKALGEELGIEAEALVLTAGTSEAYGYLFALLGDAGGAVLVPTPSYPLLEILARLHDLEIVTYPLRYDGSWHIDLPALRERCSPQIRAIVVVSPNNPTGSYLKYEELDALLALERPLIVDQVFEPYALRRPADAVSSFEGLEDGLVFVLDGLSKRAALPQAKLSWIACFGARVEVLEAGSRLEIFADAHLSVAEATQSALPELLAYGRGMQPILLERLRSNLAFVQQWFSVDSAASVLHVEGGWTVIVRLPAIATEEQYVLQLLERDVLVQPGWLYDLQGGPHIVLSLLTPPGTFRDGLLRIAETLERLIERETGG